MLPVVVAEKEDKRKGKASSTQLTCTQGLEEGRSLEGTFPLRDSSVTDARVMQCSTKYSSLPPKNWQKNARMLGCL